MILKKQKTHQLGDFSGGLVVRTCASSAGAIGSILGWGTPHTPRGVVKFFKKISQWTLFFVFK